MRHKLTTLPQILALLILASSLVHAQQPEVAAQEEATTTGSDAKANESNLPRVKPNLEAERLKLLGEEIKPSDITWIESANGQFMALWQQDKSSTTYGAILLLHGQGRSLEWPNSIQALRKNLSLHGWATLTIDLPPLEKPKVPPRPIPQPSPMSEGEQSAQEEASAPIPADNNTSTPTTPMQSAEKLSDERVGSAIEFLQSKGQYNIVIIGQGSSAVRAARYINTSSAPFMRDNMNKAEGKIQRPIRALILLEARNHIELPREQLGSFINDAGLPILDVYFGEHFLDTLEIQHRRQLAKEKNLAHYYQVKMLNPDNSDIDYENRLTRRVRGFLNKHAKGVEIERKN